MVLSVPLVDDVFPEGLEEFEVILSASPGVFIDSPASAIVRILNDDPDLPGIYLKAVYIVRSVIWETIP